MIRVKPTTGAAKKRAGRKPAKAKAKRPAKAAKPAASKPSVGDATQEAPKREQHPNQDRTGSHKLTDASLVIEVLRQAGGIKAVAAHHLKVSRTTLYKFIDAHPEVADALQEIDGELGDIAESKIIEAIRGGDMQTVRWYAEMKMRDRGYARRSEVTGPNGGPVETRQAPDLAGYTDEELAIMRRHAERREAVDKGK